MTVFQVESRLFRVHRHFLAENSLVFSSMFSLPRGTPPADASTGAEGASDANPIFLSSVTVLEFEALLRYFYKSMHDGFSLPQATWIALLSIAHRYEFLNVRERAIREIYGPLQLLNPHELLLPLHHPQSQLQPQPPPPQQQERQEDEVADHAQLVSIAERYDVPLRHMLPLLVALVTRMQPLAENEVACISALNVSRLAQAREEYVRTTARPSVVSFGSRNEWLGWMYEVGKDVVNKTWRIPNEESSQDRVESSLDF